MQCIRAQKSKSRKSCKYFISLSPIKSSYITQISPPTLIEDNNLSPRYNPKNKLNLPKFQGLNVIDIKSPANKKSLPEFYKYRNIQSKQALISGPESSPTEANHLTFSEKKSQNCLVF